MSARSISFYRKKNAEATLYFPLTDPASQDRFEASPVSFAAGDIQVSIDGGAFGNANNTPAHEGLGIYSLVLDAAELNGAFIVVTLVDQTSSAAWDDLALLVETPDVIPSEWDRTEGSELTAISGSSSPYTFKQMIQWLFRRWFNKHDNNQATLTVYQEDDASTLTAQSVSNSGGVQTVEQVP